MSDEILAIFGALTVLALVIIGMLGMIVAGLKVAEILGLEGFWKFAFLVGIIILFLKK